MRKYRDDPRLLFFEVYIHEAHPGENIPQYPEFADFEQPTTIEEKIELFEFYRTYIVTKPLVSGDTTIIHALIDSMSMNWENAYSKLVTCGYVIGFDGTIKINTGFLREESQIDDMEAVIADELSNTSVQPVEKTQTNELQNSVMISNNRITVNGLITTGTVYSMYSVNGALVQQGTVDAMNSTIELAKYCAAKVVLLKLRGDVNLIKRVVLY